MSFSEDYKRELWEEEPPRRPCCRHALAQGLLFCAQTQDAAFQIKLPAKELGEKIAEFLSHHLHTEVSRREGTHVGRPYLSAELISRPTYARFQRADMSDLPLSEVLGFDCENCARYFLRGVLIAAGSITDPLKSYHLEISCRDSATARRLSALFGEITVTPKTIKRPGGTHLYYKNSAEMEDIFSYLHARHTLFALINSKIEREIRNNENRATNCVAQNIQKAVRAAAEQSTAIECLKKSSEWDKLPTTLRATAELRLEHPDATLQELALLHLPPITKSGLNHRLQKLNAIAAEVAQKQN